MEQVLISRKELAERWGITTMCVIKYEESGIITRVSGLTVPRYNLNEILKIEQTDMSETSPLVVKQLKKRNKELEEENAKLNQKLNLVRQALI